jgi:hypothetical protein
LRNEILELEAQPRDLTNYPTLVRRPVQISPRRWFGFHEEAGSSVGWVLDCLIPISFQFSQKYFKNVPVLI